MWGAGDPEALLCFEGLAGIEVFQGRASSARALISWALSTRQPTPRFLRESAQLEKRCGDDAAATQLFARAARMAPGEYKTWLLWGALEKRRQDYAAASRWV